MSTELAAGHVSLFAEMGGFARDAAQGIDRVGRDAQQTLNRAFDRAGNDLRQALGQAGGQAAGDLQQALGRAGQSAGQAGGRAAARGFSAQLNQIDASAFNRIARGAEGAGEEIQRLNRWQLNDLIREANRAGQQLGTDVPTGASNAERALRRLDAQGLENLLRSAREAQRALGRVEDEATQASRSASDAARSAGQQGGDAAAGGIADSLSGKAGMIGQVLGTVFAAAGVSAGGLFVKSLMGGLEREKALDLTQARLGIDDATMAKIGLAAGRSYAGNFGESVEGNIDAARRAVQSGLLDSSATAQETEAVISQLTSVSDLMGEEIPATARAAGQAIKTGLAGNATEAFDLFVAAEQNGLNVSEDFLDSIIEYGTQFRKLGVTGPEAIGLINQAVLAGARDSDTAADAIKEFAIRVVDGSKSTTEAFKTLGFNADDLTARFAAGGGSARTAVSELLAEIRKIEDPVKRNEVALALFGTKAEDLGEALNHFNVDTAVDSLGKVGGAAAAAIQTMGGNTAGSIESAKRSIETSADAISGALAKAFGPELAKLADWITDHQPEILGFLGNLADGALVTGDAFLAFASAGLRGFALFAEGVGGLLEHILDPIGKVAEVIGRLTGNSGLADLGHTLQDLNTKMSGVADSAFDLADGIDNTARPGLDRMRDSVRGNIEQAQMSAEVFRALGDTVTALPSEHGIELKDNTPEATQRLEALGLKVTTLPNGQVFVDAKTDGGQRIIDAFVAQNTGREVPITARVTFLDINGNVTSDPARQTVQVPGGRYATGGLFHGAGGPTEDANIVRLSDGEFVTNAAQTADNLPLLQAINAGWTPSAEFVRAMVGDLPGYADGGVASKRALDFARSQNGKPYIYGDRDCSWYMSGIYNQLTGKSVRFTTVSDFAALGFKPGLDPNGFSIGTDGGVGVNGHMTGTLLGTDVESDGSNGVQFGGTADGADALPKQWHLPRDLWSPPETDDPSKGSGSPSLNAGTGGGAGSPGAGGASGLGGSAAPSGGGTFGGVTVPAGVVPVWVVGTGGTTGTNPASPTPSDSFAPQASTPQASQGPDLAARANEAGTDFFNANLDQFLGDIGARRSGGAVQAIGAAVFDAIAKAINEDIRRRTTQVNSFARR